jgi:hypothetical protein
MLEQMKNHNNGLKEHFWDEEKHITQLKAELLQLNDLLRQK